MLREKLKSVPLRANKLNYGGKPGSFIIVVTDEKNDIVEVELREFDETPTDIGSWKKIKRRLAKYTESTDKQPHLNHFLRQFLRSLT